MVRSALVVGEGPIHGLLGRLESMAGLRVFHLDLPPKVAAFQFWSEETGAVVVLHRGHPHERRRFSLAHETGHFLHDREAGDVLEADGPGRYDEHERFADAFAAELLLPEHGVKRNFHELVEGRAGAFTLAEVLAMADAWEVSFQAIMVRLEDLSLLPRGTFERVREAGFKPEVARRELGVTRQVARPQVVPERYRDLAIGAWENELISESELADHLHVDRLEARLIVESRQMVRLDDGSQVPADLGADILHAVGV